MTTTINASLAAQLTLLVTRDDVDSAGSLDTVHSAFNQAQTLNADSTPPVTKKYAAELTGTQTLDLTAAADPELGTLDMSGLKLQAMLVVNLSTTDNLVVEDGAANPYQVNAGDTIVIEEGGENFALMYFGGKLADVAAGAKNLKFTAAPGESYQVILVFG